MDWQANGFRSAIQRTKMELTDEFVFLSERYLKLLRRISGQITRTHFTNIRIDNDKSKPPGFYDGSVISVNLANPITQSFPSKELKNKSLIGLLGHECGHENYSNPYLRGKYLDGILKERKIYPHAPVPESPGEQAALEAMKEEFERETSAVVFLYFEMARYLSNILEDIYIENRMCSRFPGNIREGIILNNVRMTEEVESVRTMLENGRKKSFVMLNMVAQYGISGQVNFWDGCGQEYLDCLDACIPLVDKAVQAPEDSARYEATNQILLKMWDFIKEDASAMEEEQKEREKNQEQKKDPEDQEEQNDALAADQADGGNEEDGSNTAEGDKKGADQDASSETGEPNHSNGTETVDAGASQASTGSGESRESEVSETGVSPEGTRTELSAESGKQMQNQVRELAAILPQYSSDYQGGKRCEAADMRWDGNWDAQEERETASGGQGVEDSGDTQKRQPEQNTADAAVFAAYDSADAEEKPEFDRDASMFVFQMAKEIEEQKREEQLEASLRELMERIDFGDAHVFVRKQVYRAPLPVGDCSSRYAEIERKLKHIRKRLHARILPILEKQKSRTEAGMMIGRKLSSRTLYRPDQRIFVRRQLEGNVCDTAIAILVDLSGSMSEGRIEYARLAALTLYQFSAEADIPVTVYGHNTVRWEDGSEMVCLYSFAEFGMADGKDRFRIMDMRPYGRNRDGVAVRFVGELLRNRPEKQKLFVLISDGLPNAVGYVGARANEDLKNAKTELEQAGIVFLAAAIGSDRAKVRRIYGDECLDITDLRKLPELLAKRVLQEISQ